MSEQQPSSKDLNLVTSSYFHFHDMDYYTLPNNSYFGIIELVGKLNYYNTYYCNLGMI